MFFVFSLEIRVIERTKKRMKEYLPYAYINRYRINYTLLTELALANKHKESKYQEKIQLLLNDLKKHKKTLLKSGIVFSRKIMISVCCFSYQFYSCIVRLLHRIRK